MDLVITKKDNKIITALIDNNRLIELKYEEDSPSRLKVDAVYVGKVSNIVNNINAAFVRIDNNELCFLQFDSEDVLKKVHNEMEIPVQIIHDRIKTKQPAVSSNIKLTGRYLIRTGRQKLSVSSKITDVSKRKELIDIMTKTDAGNSGYIIRTNAAYASPEKIEAEYHYLENKYADIMSKAEHSKPYSCIYMPPYDYICRIRDLYDHDIEKIVTDSEEIYDDISEYFGELYSEVAGKLSLYKDSYPMWAFYGLTGKIEKAANERVWLDSGAYIIIQITEACTVIDVNTGKAVKNKKSKEKNFYDINIEAAKEIFLQLRLRNLSGMIIVDFIDMKSEEYNDGLFSYVNSLAKLDPVKTDVIDRTGLGLIEITKKISAPTDFGRISF